MVHYFKFTLAIFNFNCLTLKLIEKIGFLYFSNNSSPIFIKSQFLWNSTWLHLVNLMSNLPSCDLLFELSWTLLMLTIYNSIINHEFLPSYVRMIWFFIILKHDDTYTTELHFLCEQIEASKIFINVLILLQCLLLNCSTKGKCCGCLN